MGVVFTIKKQSVSKYFQFLSNNSSKLRTIPWEKSGNIRRYEKQDPVKVHALQINILITENKGKKFPYILLQYKIVYAIIKAGY